VVSVNDLGKVRIGKVKSVSGELVRKYPTAFSTDFDINKKLIYQYTDIRSKHLNNRVAGYVTRLLVSQKTREEALKLEEAELASQQSAEAPAIEGAPQENAPSEAAAETATEATEVAKAEDESESNSEEAADSETDEEAEDEELTEEIVEEKAEEKKEDKSEEPVTKA
jgi:small subunit ribosomal protein S17e